MYKLATYDAFFFRGNGEFSSGENTFATGIFPPNPQTIYGALRGNWIEQYGNVEDFNHGKYANEIGTPTSHGKLRLKGIYLSKGKTLYLPLPQDCQVIQKEDGKLEAHLLELEKGKGYESDGAQFRLVGVSNKKSESAEGKWITVKDWEKLVLKREPVEVLPLGSFVQEQPKTGIYLNRSTRTAQDGMLYQYSRNVLAPDVSIVIAAELPGSLKRLSMGNKGTLWSIEEAPEFQGELKKLSDNPETVKGIKESGLVRITLLTPSLVTKELIDKDTNQFRFTGTDWIQSAIGRPQQSGGWDMARKRPKTRYTMLAAGTSFIVRVPETNSDAFLATLRETAFTDAGKEEGYGKAIISPVNLIEEG